MSVGSDGGLGVPGLDIGVFEGIGVTSLREVGRGASSTVYAGFQTRHGRDVALKVFSAPLREDKARRRFNRECKTHGRLSIHPNVVNLYDSGFDASQRPFIVMELCGGGSLEDVIDATGPMSATDVLRVGVKVCSALQFAHTSGVPHRDIKPANILLTSFGEPVLSDFGISGDTSTGMSWTMRESLTPLYAAPEVLERGGATSEAICGRSRARFMRCYWVARHSRTRTAVLSR